ncbi:hypothetical protein DSM104299_04730 [Baekduia alba]|uniref:hypothetical protein n=1 Tax=Baekduia alba TaxID=2997333 RepID=UPI00234091D2|nr:hypothetical protein [Baekduia alba]WCB95978.1 hypothetical protein DSM104299_04730 [Baekduia alba]
MSGEDPHDPATAGPEAVDAAVQAPDAPVAVPAPDPGPQPTPTVGSAEASYGAPAGSAMLGGAGDPVVDPNPEKLVGAAFGGGLVVALLLKGLARRKHS